MSTKPESTEPDNPEPDNMSDPTPRSVRRRPLRTSHDIDREALMDTPEDLERLSSRLGRGRAADLARRRTSATPPPAEPAEPPPPVEPVPGPEVFAVPVGPGGGLEAIVAALARLLADMGSPTHTGALFLYPQDQPGRFSQCLVDVENGAWVECVSNNYLADADRLDPDQEQMLVDLGFCAPEDGRPNFWLVQDQPVSCDEVAHLMAAPFATVFPVRDHEVMELTVNRHFRERDPNWDAE